MVAFIGLHGVNHPEDAGKALHRTGVQGESVEDVLEPPQSVFRVFNGGPADDAVDFVAFESRSSAR